MVDTVEEVVAGAEAPVGEAADAPEVEAPPDSEFAAAPDGGAPVEGDAVANNKRKFEETDGDADAEQPHIRKRGSFEDVDPEPTAPVKTSGFSDAPAAAATTGFSDTAPLASPNAVPEQNGAVTPVAPAAVGSPTDGQITEYVEIPAAMVGKLIGKGGETIKALQFTTHTKVQIDHQTGGDLKKVSIMSANRDAIENAKAQIDKIVNSDEPVTGIGEVSRQVDCPQGIVGRIIGRGGETIRALQQASQAHIVVDQNFPEGHPRSVNIKGRPDAVERATKMVQELIQGEPGSAQAIIQKYGAGITKSLDCPKQMVGRVIGKGGDTIKTLQKQFGANIQIDQQCEPNKITVAGAAPAVDACLAAVHEIINGGNPIMQQAPSGPGGGGGGPFGGRGGPMPYGAGPRGPAPFGGPFPQGGYGGPATPPAFNPYGGYGAPGPAPGYGGYPHQPAYPAYPAYPAQQPAYPQPAPQAAAAGGYPGYGGQPAAADPYASQQASYGAPYGQAPSHAHAAAPSVWQELQDGEGRSYYYNQSNGVSQWEKPAEMA